MIRLSNLNKLLVFVIIFTTLFFNPLFAEDEPADIWKKTEIKEQQLNNNEIEEKNESIIFAESNNKKIIKIDENKIKDFNQSVVGILDPEVNNFNLEMWSKTNGEEIKKVLMSIDKLKLSELSENLLFQILFTNSYSPKNNLDTVEFLKIKIDWLISKKRIEDLEVLLKNNPLAGENSKAVKFLIDEYLASANINSACEKIKFIDQKIKNDYLNKFTIYCLIYSNKQNEAQLIFDLLLESGFEDKFFEDKINFLLNISDQTTNKVLDDNLLNFYLSYITSEKFDYKPNDKTDRYIWKYISAINLIKINDLQDETEIQAYEEAATQNSFDKDEIFKIYLKMNFDFNQLSNAEKIYKDLPNYKARALIYQSMMLNDNIDKKINLAFLLKDLFIKDKLGNIYFEELSDILKSIDPDQIPEMYQELAANNIDVEDDRKIKFNNEILHRSKILKHFLETNVNLSRTEKDFKSIYKKIKRNRKYFISINDIIVLESLAADGVSLPEDLKYNELSSDLTVPKNLKTLADQNQIGLVMLKIVEIIGEDDVRDLDPETIYFINKILNDLNLKKIRNSILSEALPARV